MLETVCAIQNRDFKLMFCLVKSKFFSFGGLRNSLSLQPKMGTGSRALQNLKFHVHNKLSERMRKKLCLVRMISAEFLVKSRLIRLE